MLYDLRHALRTFRRAPAFTIAAALCLALGIGANTAIFSIVEAALLRPLPVPHPEQLVIIEGVTEQGDSVNFSYPQYAYLREHSRSLAALGHAQIQLSLAAGDVTDTPAGESVSDNYFSVMGVQPALGRFFTPHDDAVAVLSHRYWRSRFHGEAAIVGRTVSLNGLAFTVIGVAEARFFGVTIGSAPDVFVPVTMRDRLLPEFPRLAANNSFWLDVMGRLAPGADVRQAGAEATTLYRQANLEGTRGLAPGHPLARYLRNMGVALSDGSRGAGGTRNQFGKPLAVLMGIVGLVLAIACANVAGLLVAQATARQREIAVRLALGAGPARLMRQVLTESVVLSLAGGLAGLILAWWGAAALVGFLDGAVLDVAPDLRVLAFTFLVAVACGLLFGVLPAMKAGRQNVAASIRNEAPVTGFRRLDLRGGLVAAQVAISLLLVVGAGLLVRTLVNLRELDTGMHADRVVVASFNPVLNRYSRERARDFYDRLLERVSGLPGVSAASLADQPLLGGAMYVGVSLEGRTFEPGHAPTVAIKFVTPRFFETMGIALRAGRDFSPRDRAGSPKVAIVNDRFAQRFFPGQNPIGKRVGWRAADMEIVGVIADTRYNALREPAPSTLYAALEQLEEVPSARTLHVRTTARPESVVSAIREQARQIDPDLPVSKIGKFSSLVDARLGQERLVASLAGFFGALALALVAVGLYGVMAYMAQCRRREIGIRVSLGAAHRTVIWMIMRRALWIAAVGVAIGAPASVWLSRLLRSLLFGVAPGDPLTMAAAILLLLGVAALASYLPARRAVRVDPMVALRYE